MKEIYTVPTEAREDVFKTVKRLQKKAAAYGKTLIVEEGPAYAKERKIYERDSETNVHHVVNSELVEVFDLTVESDIIMKDGYTVVARIEHLEGGNVVHDCKFGISNIFKKSLNYRILGIDSGTLK